MPPVRRKLDKRRYLNIIIHTIEVILTLSQLIVRQRKHYHCLSSYKSNAITGYPLICIQQLRDRYSSELSTESAMTLLMAAAVMAADNLD